jgi:hypothetical protein
MSTTNLVFHSWFSISHHFRKHALCFGSHALFSFDLSDAYEALLRLYFKYPLVLRFFVFLIYGLSRQEGERLTQAEARWPKRHSAVQLRKEEEEVPSQERNRTERNPQFPSSTHKEQTIYDQRLRFCVLVTRSMGLIIVNASGCRHDRISLQGSRAPGLAEVTLEMPRYDYIILPGAHLQGWLSCPPANNEVIVKARLTIHSRTNLEDRQE